VCPEWKRAGDSSPWARVQVRPATIRASRVWPPGRSSGYVLGCPVVPKDHITHACEQAYAYYPPTGGCMRLNHKPVHLNRALLSTSPWHGPHFQVLHVEMFGFPSGKIPVYECPLLPKPETGVVCHEGGSETEFATAGTWFILGIEQSTSSCATLGLLWKVYE
jgi:hypothetical protein